MIQPLKERFHKGSNSWHAGGPESIHQSPLSTSGSPGSTPRYRILCREKQKSHLGRYPMSGKSDSILGEPCSMLEGMHFTPILQVFMLRELDSMLGGPISLFTQWILMWKSRFYAWKGSINNYRTQINAGNVQISYRSFRVYAWSLGFCSWISSFQPWRIVQRSWTFKRINFQFLNF